MSTSTQAAAGHLAITIAERLLDPAVVLAAASGRPGDCLQGLAGTALLHARLAQVDPASKPPPAPTGQQPRRGPPAPAAPACSAPLAD